MDSKGSSRERLFTEGREARHYAKGALRLALLVKKYVSEWQSVVAELGSEPALHASRYLQHLVRPRGSRLALKCEGRASLDMPRMVTWGLTPLRGCLHMAGYQRREVTNSLHARDLFHGQARFSRRKSNARLNVAKYSSMAMRGDVSMRVGHIIGTVRRCGIDFRCQSSLWLTVKRRILSVSHMWRCARDTVGCGSVDSHVVCDSRRVQTPSPRHRRSRLWDGVGEVKRLESGPKRDLAQTESGQQT